MSTIEAVKQAWLDLGSTSSGRTRAIRRRKARAYRWWIACEIAEAYRNGNINPNADVYRVACAFLDA